MSWLIKQVLIVLLSFGESLATKYVSLNNELCMIRPTLIGLNLAELNYYPCMINLDGSCNVVYKKCVPSKTKGVNVKVCNVIIRTLEAKISIKHISCNCKYKFN